MPSHAGSLSAVIPPLAAANSWRAQVPLGYRSPEHSRLSRRPRRRLITQSASPPFRSNWLPTR